MKFGPRTPNYKKRFQARTKGRLKRQAKRAVNPFYGKKGMGWINNPKRAAYNKVYHRTTFDSLSVKGNSSPKKKEQHKMNAKSDAVKEVSQSSVAMNSKDAFYTEETKTVQRKPWSYGWLGILVLAIRKDTISSVIIVGLLLAFIIYRHNQKPMTQTKTVKRSLTSGEKKELLQHIDQLSKQQESLINRINSTVNLDIYFKAIEDHTKILNELVALTKKYHLPFRLEVGARRDGVVEELSESDLKDVFDEGITHFIDKYFNEEQGDAAKLKTHSGYINRMKRKKEELLAYHDHLSKRHLDQIDALWGDIDL